MSRITSVSEWLLRQGVVWGGLFCLAFYAFVVRPADDASTIGRYFDGDGWEVKYATATLFFVGLAGLTIRMLGLLVQFGALERTGLSAPPADGQTPADADRLLAEVDAAHESLQDGYFLRRLRHALLYVKDKGSADALDDQLRRLEDVDLDRMNQSYATVRVIASTIPILGFLGTVIGITLAIGQLSGKDMELSLPNVIAGLSVAFDTTAQALALSIVLLFTKFAVERVDGRLLSLVDERVNRELLGRFQQLGSSNDPHLASVRRMNEQLLATIESAAARQTALMGDAFARVASAWEHTAASAANALRESLADSLAAGLDAHAHALNEGVAAHTRDMKDMLVRHAEILSENVEQHAGAFVAAIETQGETLAGAMNRHAELLVATERDLGEQNRRHLAEVEAALGEAMVVAASRQEKLIQQSEELLREMQVALVEAAGTTVAQQEQLIKQSDVLLRVVESTGAVRKLEEALVSNLTRLATVHDFEKLVNHLSTSLQLLNLRIGRPLAIARDDHSAETPSETNSKSQAA